MRPSSFHPQSPAVTAPVGHAASLCSAGTSAASVSLLETLLTLRCGPDGHATVVFPPPVTCGDSPVGACGFATLRRHLRCFGFLPETSLTLRCGPEGLATFVCLPPVTCGDSPGGAHGFATLRRHLRCIGFPAGNLADAPVRP